MNKLLIIILLAIAFIMCLNFNEYFEPALIDTIFYINLDHRKDRNKDTINELKKNFPGIYTKRFSSVYDKNNGAIGCLKSHIMMLKYALENHPGQNILFCEDDIQFLHNPKKYLKIFLSDKKLDNWNVLMLAHNTYKHEKTHNKNILKIVDSQTGSCYLVRGNYIPILLKNYENALTHYEQSGIWKDEYCNDQCWKILQKRDHWYTIMPRLCKQRIGYSDIQKGVVNYNV